MIISYKTQKIVSRIFTATFNEEEAKILRRFFGKHSRMMYDNLLGEKDGECMQAIGDKIFDVARRAEEED